MNLNSSTIARDSTAMSLDCPDILHRGACRTQDFCTALVGPPPDVQNFWHPNASPTKNFQPHHASAHQTSSYKTQESTSATHFRSNEPETNVQKFKVERQATRVKSHTLFRSTLPTPHSPFRPATDAQNPGAEFCAPRKNPVQFIVQYRTSTILQPAPM